MTWKDIPNNNDDREENFPSNERKEGSGNSPEISNEQEYSGEENPFDEQRGAETFEIEESSTTDDLSPKNKDIRSRNKKLILVMGVFFILLGIFVYLASLSREKPQVVQQEKELKMKLPQEDEVLQENTAILALKKEVEELKYKKQTQPLDKQQSAKMPVSIQKEDANQSTSRSKVSRPPLPPPVANSDFQDSQDPLSRQTFPDRMFEISDSNQQKKEVYKVVLVDNPFQSGTFSYSAKATPAVYTVKSEIVRDEKAGKGNNSQEKLLDNAEQKQTKVKHSNKLNKSKKKKSETFTVPAGSFFKVVLLNGVDAPTGMGGKASPYPVIGRVLTDSVLPNRFFADMKGCFVLGDATGELSSERVIMRFTKISCVTRTGKVIEKDILGFIAGEDGKYGLIGRVVSKAGAQLGRVLLAKFVESAGNILTLQSQTISASGLGTVSTIKPEEAGQAAVFSGFAGAAKSLSDYYLKLADQIFPVIEINAGRQGDVVLLQNLTINLNSDLKDNGGFIQRDGILSGKSSPEDKVFKIKEEIK